MSVLFTGLAFVGDFIINFFTLVFTFRLCVI